MLLFSTVLSINDTMSKDDFIRLAIEWNQGSPHKENVIPGLVWNGERNIRYGDDSLWLAIEEYRNQNTIAIRYEKTETDGVVWDTDYVMNFNDMKMSVRLDRSCLESALTVESGFSTPHFISLLVEKGYIKDDNNLPVSNRPVIIDKDNLDILVDVINGVSHYRLPVVYISKTFFGEDPVNVKAIYYMPTRRKVDITNLHEALHDVLTHYAVVADDNSNIIAATDGSRVRYDKTNPRTEVTITPMNDEPCQQMMELDVKDSF